MTHPEQPGWLRDAVFYQVFPDRFRNANPAIDPEGVTAWDAPPTRASFFGGDLAGITEGLDHVQSLGANTLYLTPIFEADTPHRYDTADYLRIDHRLGSLDDFRALVRQVHERGMRIVLDGVFNHTGEGHWAFRHVYAHGERSPYADWYSVQAHPIVRDPRPNYAAFAACPYLPQLNHANPAVQEHVREVALRWLGEGIDGWRLDVPFEVPSQFWTQFRAWVRDAYPGAYICGEVWELATEYLQGDMFDGTMNYPLRTAILRFASGASTSAGFGDELRAYLDATPAWARPGMMNLVGSHDTARLRRTLGDDDFAIRVAVALQLTSEGAPMIYYGDEVGLDGGDDPDNRRTMSWEPATWDQDLLAFHRRLLRLRAETPSLTGPGDAVLASADDLLVRRRGAPGEASYLLINRGTAETHHPIEGFVASTAVDLGSGKPVPWSDELTVPGRSILLLTGTVHG
jgi:glycosidase